MRSGLENQLPGLPTLQFEEQFVRPKPGRTLIVGSRVYEGREDRRPLFADAIGVDMLAGPGVDRVLNLEDPLPSDLGQFDHVECISVLEHSKRPWKLAANLTRLMSMGATIYLAAPFIWRVHNFPNDYFRYTRYGLCYLLERAGFVVTGRATGTWLVGEELCDSVYLELPLNPS